MNNKVYALPSDVEYGSTTRIRPATTDTVRNEIENANAEDKKSFRELVEHKMLKKVRVKNAEPIPYVDMKGIADVFNSYATKKSLSTGFFNIALVIWGMEVRRLGLTSQ